MNDHQIAKAISLAQVASDAGKGSPMHWVVERTKKFVDSREAVFKLIKAFDL